MVSPNETWFELICKVVCAVTVGSKSIYLVLLAPHRSISPTPYGRSTWEKETSATSNPKFFALSGGCAKHTMELLSSARCRSDQ